MIAVHLAIISIVLTAILMLIPATLIFRSNAVQGWEKARWVLACLFAGIAIDIALGLGLFALFGSAIFTHLIATVGGYEYMIMVLGFANVVSAWHIRRFFKEKFSGSNPDASS